MQRSASTGVWGTLAGVLVSAALGGCSSSPYQHNWWNRQTLVCKLLDDECHERGEQDHVVFHDVLLRAKTRIQLSDAPDSKDEKIRVLKTIHELLDSGGYKKSSICSALAYRTIAQELGLNIRLAGLQKSIMVVWEGSQDSVLWNPESGVLVPHEKMKDVIVLSEKKQELALVSLEQGIWCFGQGNNERAIALLDDAVEQDPASRVVYYHRGRMCVKMGEVERAIGDFSKLIELDKEYPEWYVLRARAYLKNKSIQKGFDDCTTAIKIKDDYAEAYCLRARLRLEKGEWWRDILPDVTTALRLNPFDPVAYRTRGNVRQILGMTIRNGIRDELVGAHDDFMKANELEKRYAHDE